MKLNKADKIKLRSKLEELLNGIEFDPENRIYIPKGKLEQILFDYDSEHKCKIIGYKTDNLCKLDLSEISFENVDLYLSPINNLSNTNVNIDFSKLHFSLATGYANLYNVASFIDFTNVNLVGMSLAGASVDGEHNVFCFDKCNFTDTHMWSSFDNIKGYVEFRYCDFTGNYLSEPIEDHLSYFEKRNIRYRDCTFTNTCVTINTHYNFKDTVMCREIEKFRGCYIKSPDKKVPIFIKRKNELEHEKKCILQEYESFEERKIKEIIDAILMWGKYVSTEDGTINISENEKYKFNKNGIEKLRYQLVVALAGKTFDKKIKLPKKIMEMILFDRTVRDGNTIKSIALHGDIAKLFDYSEIDFENVSLDCKENVEKNHVVVSLNETANIDFSKTYEYKKDNQLVASYIDLRGVKLESKDMQALTKENIATFTRVNLEDADIQMNEYVNAFFFECNLTDVFLGSIQLDLNSKNCVFNDKLKFVDCNLRNTGVNLVDYESCTSEDFKKVYTDNNYFGCYVNGKLIKSFEDIEETKKDILLKYDKYSTNIINKTLSLVKKQIREKDAKQNETK